MLTFGSTFSIPPWRLIALLVFWRLWQVWSILMLWSLLARSLSSWWRQFRLTPSWWFTCSRVLFIWSWQDLILSTSLISEFSTPSLTMSMPFRPSLKTASASNTYIIQITYDKCILNWLSLGLQFLQELSPNFSLLTQVGGFHSHFVLALTEVMSARMSMDYLAF